MDMHLKIVLLTALVACVCSHNVPDQSQSASNLRNKRGALSKFSLHSENELDDSAEYRRFLYNLEDLDSDGYDGDITSSGNEPTVVVVPAPKTSNSGSIKVLADNQGTKSLISKRIFAHNDYQSNQRSKKVSDDSREGKLASLYSQTSKLYEEVEENVPAKYDFKYAVNDPEHLDLKSHKEERNGDTTIGEYSVLQPDGTILTVKYTVHGDEGYQAVVTKSELPEGFDHKV